MVAKANNEGRSSPAVLKSPSNDAYESSVMTDHERQLLQKYIRLIQGNIPNKVRFGLLLYDCYAENVFDISFLCFAGTKHVKISITFR